MSGYKYSLFRRGSLFFEHEIDRQHEEKGPEQVVEPERFGFEKQGGENGEDEQCDDLLDHFELQEAERASGTFEADAVRRRAAPGRI